MIGYEDLTWAGDRLRYRGRTLATIEPDADWPKLYRVRLSNGHLTDMVNLTRAKDVARCLASADLNHPRETKRSLLVRLTPSVAKTRRMARTYTKIDLQGDYVCVYCGKNRGSTWDHVYPAAFVLFQRFQLFFWNNESSAVVHTIKDDLKRRNSCARTRSQQSLPLYLSFPMRRSHKQSTLAPAG